MITLGLQLSSLSPAVKHQPCRGLLQVQTLCIVIGSLQTPPLHQRRRPCTSVPAWQAYVV